GEHRCFITQDVAEHVVREDHIELRRLCDELHRAVIDIHALEDDVRKLLRYFGTRLAPQYRCFQYIRLVDRSHAASSMPGKLESNFGNTANLIARIDFGVKRLHFVHSARRSKIDPTKKLAHNDQIDATNTITSQRRAINERFENSDWPQIRVIAQ